MGVRSSAFFAADLPRGQHLVSPHWLHALLQGQPVPAGPNASWRLFEVCTAPEPTQGRSHLPGAALLHTQRMEALPFWNKVDDAVLLQYLLELGVTQDSTVILYSRNMAGAARVAHLMLYAGVRDLRLLNGGLQAWALAGLPWALQAAQVYAPATAFGCAVPARPALLLNLAQVCAARVQPGTVLASIRTWAEFTGETSGYSYIAAKGDIPGARWGRAGDGCDVNSMQAYQLADGSMRPAAEIAQFWQAQGIGPAHPTVFYCGTGWRASLAFFYAWVMGWEQISVFDGGWFEWSTAFCLEALGSEAL
jgi:thiosulfate/3-mercaptopyruvate sulfurtransferase